MSKSRAFDVQHEVDRLTSAGLTLNIMVEPGGWVHITAIDKYGCVYRNNQLQDACLQTAFIAVEAEREKVRIMAQGLSPNEQ